jgi:hypothetical protein
MVSQRKRQIISVIMIVLIAALALSAFAVAAQDSDEDDDSSTDGFFGRGRLAERLHDRMMIHLDEHPMLETTAEVLGLEVEDLVAQLQDGATVAEIAEAQGVDLQAIVDANLALAEERMAELVDAGDITQELADAFLAFRAQMMLDRLSGEFSLQDMGFGIRLGIGGRTGMMGRGTMRGGFFGGGRGRP